MTSEAQTTWKIWIKLRTITLEGSLEIKKKRINLLCSTYEQGNYPESKTVLFFQTKCKLAL